MHNSLDLMNLKTIGLGRVLLDGRHVTGFRYTLDDARLAARLNCSGSGISAKLYSGRSEGRVLDLARQLVRMRTDAYLFTVSSHTLGVSCELGRQLKLLRPDAVLLFFGATDGANPVLIEEMRGIAQFFSAVRIDDVLATLLSLVSSTSAVSDVDASVSPYLSGLLSSNDIGRLGLISTQDRKLLAQELEWLTTNKLAGDTAIPFHADEEDEAGLIEVCRLIAARKLDARFDFHVSASACTPAFFKAIPATNCSRLIVSGDLSALPPIAQEFKHCIVAAEDDAQRTEKAAIYGKNGNVALHTGFYFDAKQNPGIYHLELPLEMKDEDRQRVYAWAASSMDLRSATVLKGEGSAVRDRLADFVAPESRETKGWPKHSYALGIDSISGSASMTFDGVTSTQQKMTYVPLSKLDTVKARSDTVTFVTMKAAEDADELERRLRRFHESGEIVAPHPRTPLYFENSCRWMGYGTCRLPLLRRVEVSPSMQLSSCRDAGQIGTLGDTYDQIVIRVKQQQQIEEVRRECLTCQVRDKCSHCTKLPEEWGGRYCDIRKKYEHSSLYIELFSLLPAIAPLLSGIADPHVALKISYRGLPSQYYRGPIGTHQDGHRPIMMNVSNQNLAWWRGTSKLSRLSPPLALMAEAWWEGVSSSDIVESLTSTFKVDTQTAQSSLAQGLEKLRQENVIHAA